MSKAELKVFPKRMKRKCPRVELDYRNRVAAEAALLCAPVMIGGNEFMPRLMLENVLLVPLTLEERGAVLRRVRAALSDDGVSEALAAIRKRRIEEAKGK